MNKAYFFLGGFVGFVIGGMTGVFVGAVEVDRRIRQSAIEAGVGEYYHDKYLDKQFRFVKPTTEVHLHISAEDSLQLEEAKEL